MTTLLFTHDDAHLHVTPRRDDERVDRLKAVLETLADLGLDQRDAPLGTDEMIGLVHDAGYAGKIRAQIPTEGFTCLDQGLGDETFLCPTSENAIWRAVGGAVAAVDAVLSQEAANAFVAMRPPGHHAEHALPMGFCVFGNVAIAAKHALDVCGLSRVAVIDFDVHHGNGTQALLQDDPRATVITSQQVPLWPGTGLASERGPHGTVVNLALPPGTDGVYALREYETKAFPKLRAHRPELIILSAGFDAHQDDPLAQLNWAPSDYAALTRRICEEAAALCDGRVVSVLEGGYDLNGLATSARAHVKELMKAAT